MNMIKIPDDVRELVAKKKRKTIIRFLLLEAAFLAVIAIAGELLFGTFREYSEILFYSSCVVVAALPVFIVGIPKMRSDKSFCGIVESVSVKTRPVGDKDPNRPSAAKITMVNVVELLVKLDNGKTELIELNMWQNKPEHFLPYYKVGFEVYHVKGLEGYLVRDTVRNDLAYCIVCGGRESADKVRCNHCGHTLIKFKKQ